jgi:hypothetical protein
MIELPRMSALLTYPTSNTREPGRYALLRIEDEDSGQRIAEIELNPDQLFTLMAAGTAYGSGIANVMGHRFGRRRVHRTVQLDREDWGLEYDSDESHNAIRAHLKVARDDGWEVVTYERKRGQHYITMIRWEEIDEVEPAGDGGGAPGA